MLNKIILFKDQLKPRYIKKFIHRKYAHQKTLLICLLFIYFYYDEITTFYMSMIMLKGVMMDDFKKILKNYLHGQNCTLQPARFLLAQNIQTKRKRLLCIEKNTSLSINLSIYPQICTLRANINKVGAGLIMGMLGISES